jgi:hypothetical protein
MGIRTFNINEFDGWVLFFGDLKGNLKQVGVSNRSLLKVKLHSTCSSSDQLVHKWPLQTIIDSFRTPA